MTIPASAELCEVGPRDGFQFESTPIPTELKLDVIRRLVQAGIARLQATSFVHPRLVPQMADAEHVVEGLPREGATRFSGLALNMRGLERASAAGLTLVDLSIATHEQHAKDNANMTVDQGLSAALAMVDRAAALGVEVQLGFQTVFGYREPGDTDLDAILAMIGRFAGANLESLSIADSTGLANPLSVRSVVRAVRDALPDVPLVLHLHDTRGLGLANVSAALAEGVRHFDTSLGGLGGCPFIPGATGNIPTEDTAYLLEQMGVATGLDIAAISGASRAIADHLGRRLAGRLYTLPPYASS